AVEMDNNLPVVQEHKAAFPGYFIHNGDAATVLAELLENGKLAITDLASTILHLVTAGPGTWELRALEQLARLLAARNHRGLAELPRGPRAMKYLAPILSGHEPLASDSTAWLRTRLIWGTRDGPFSATVTPAAWAASVRAVLEAAARKYGGRPRAAARTER